MVSWYEARDFCAALTDLPDERAAGRRYRLPTEAEWEYACRTGTTTAFHFGGEFNPELANGCRHHPTTLPVGSYAPNDFGLYDMHGQVREWCADWYDRLYYRHGPRADPQGPDDGQEKVIRGGSYDVGSAHYMRSAYRVYTQPTNRLPGIGLRVLCEVEGRDR